MRLHFSFARVTLVFLTLSVAGLLGGSEAAWTPKLNLGVSWEGSVWELGYYGNLLISRIKPDGYICESYYNEREDDDPGLCTREAWDLLPTKFGIFYGGGHGNFGNFAVVAFQQHKHAADYVKAGNGPLGWSVREDKDTNTFICWVSHSWLRANWKPTCDANRSIMWWGVCHSADGVTSSLIQAAGGREAFGYHGVITIADDKQNIPAIFDRMNGSEPKNAPGTMRRADQAFNPGGNGLTPGPRWVTRQLRRFGNGATTLCPSVLHPITQAVYPVGGDAPGSGTGYIVLDTHCATFVEIKKLVSDETPVSKTIIFYPEKPSEPYSDYFMAFQVLAAPASGVDVKRV